MTFYSNPKRDYVLNPRGKALYDDSNRFGTKMLEKMGWSKGKGLGANLDGQLEFIKVSHKGDQKGVGFKDRDDQWTTHESNFNSLLSSFQSAENSDEESVNCPVQRFQSEDKSAKPKKDSSEKDGVFSGVSLEERSKNSRARVHYKKFTRGKDLARYSEKDLANIFGKKSLKCEKETESSNDSNENENLDKSSENTPNFGITTIETGTTINDYFKNKMKNVVNGSKKSSNEQDTNTEADVTSNKKEKKRNKKAKSSESSAQNPETGDDDDNHATSDVTIAAVDSAITVISESEKRKRDGDDDGEPKPKKKKKSLNNTVEPLESEMNLNVEASSTSKKSKKVKREKVLDSSATNEAIAEADCETVTENAVQRTKKSKKSKRSDTSECQLSSENKPSNENETVVTSDTHNDESENAQPKKKSKKNRKTEQIESGDGVPPTSAAEQQSTNLFEVVSNLGDERNAPEVVTDNVYEIRRYRTEIFRFVDLHAFPNSTLCDIPGYGYTNEMTLKIVDKGDDSRLINTLWNDALDKYANDKKKKKKFVEHIEGLKKKNIFGI